MERLSMQGCSCRTDPMSGDMASTARLSGEIPPWPDPPARSPVGIQSGMVESLRDDFLEALRDSVTVEPEPISAIEKRRLELS
jgi:hypothetical protein